MNEQIKQLSDSLSKKTERLGFAMTIADLSTPDHELIMVNNAFCEMTGFGEEMIGQNCRFLQSDCENSEARAEIRQAIETGQRTQVILKNRRKNGEFFNNLLLMEFVASKDGSTTLAVGTQFDLGSGDPGYILSSDHANGLSRVHRALNAELETRLERRRVASESAVRLVKSWIVLAEAGAPSAERRPQ